MATNALYECPVCIEKFNKSNHKVVECAFCKFGSCRSCTERFLCDTASDPQCMSCKKSWSLDFLLDNFTKKFVNHTLKGHRENLLYDREIALLPATQPLVEREIAKRRLVSERAVVIEKRDALWELYLKTGREHDEASDHFYRLKDGLFTFTDLLAKRKAVTDVHYDYKQACLRVTVFNKRMRALDRANIDNGEEEAGAGAGDSSTQQPKEKRQFVRKCPCEGCRGFLSTQYKCGICENYTCIECMEVIGPDRRAEDHKCKPENVATVKMLAKDTKPCPRCGEMIHKIEGCSQMFSTCCQVVWNWNTGNVVTSGPLHNPHYFAWRNQQGEQADAMMPRPIGDVPCGGIPDIYFINQTLRKLNMSSLDIAGVNLRVYTRWIAHMHDVVRRRYITNDISDNADLRIKYMMKELDEKHFKQVLQMREKARHRKREIEQVIAMMYEVSGDILREIRGARVEVTVVNKADEIKSLIEYGAECMNRISTKYNCSPPAVGPFVYTSTD